MLILIILDVSFVPWEGTLFTCNMIRGRLAIETS